VTLEKKKFSTSNAFFVVFVASNLDSRYFGFSFSCVHIGIAAGDCGCSVCWPGRDRKRTKYVAIKTKKPYN
jgi:hypothetical protein